jgi:hypothetical protein
MRGFLRAVSFAAGERPSYGDLRPLFTEGARLIASSTQPPQITGVDEFIALREEQLDAGRLRSFAEVEVAEITEVFGNVAHRFSTYTKRGTTDGAAIDARGAISTQFVRTPHGWRISSMAWDDERPGLELVARYRA